MIVVAILQVLRRFTVKSSIQKNGLLIFHFSHNKTGCRTRKGIKQEATVTG